MQTKDLYAERETQSAIYREFKDSDQPKAFKAIRRVFSIDAELRELDRQTPMVGTPPSHEFRGEHEAPMRDSGAPLYNLNGGKEPNDAASPPEIYPDDFYGPNGAQLYGLGDGSDTRSMAIARAIRGQRREKVTVYRAVPVDVKARISKGDWVTLERSYAVAHGRNELKGQFKIITKTVQANELFTNGDSILEWGYDPLETHRHSQRESRPSASDLQFSFAGASAFNADAQSLAAARERMVNGHDAEEVRKATGWHQGVDAKWRFEINDAQARLLPVLKTLITGGHKEQPIVSVTYCKNDDGTFDVTLNPPNPQTTRDFVVLKSISEGMMNTVLTDELSDLISRNEGEDDYIGDFKDAKRIYQPFHFQGMNALPLGEMLHHPALFAAYPSLNDLMVQVDPSLRNDGALVEMETGERVIRLGTGKQLSVLLHEIQHGIQDIEGFATGGSIKSGDTSLPLDVVHEIQDLNAQANEFGLQGQFDEARSLREQASGLRQKTAFDLYKRLAGEVEARNTQTRQNFTQAERMQFSPFDTADTQSKDMIIGFGRGDMHLDQPTPQVSNQVGNLRLAMAKAYGPLLDALESKNLVQLVSDIDEAFFEAAKARAQNNGTSLMQEQSLLKREMAMSIVKGGNLKSSQLQGFFDPQFGKSYLIAGNLTERSAPGVLMHEVGIHMARDQFMAPLYDRAAVLVKTGAGIPLFDRVIQRMREAKVTGSDEAAAYIAEEYEVERLNSPQTVKRWVSDALATVNAWFYRKGLFVKAENLTGADIAAIARANARSMKSEIQADACIQGSTLGTRDSCVWYSELLRQCRGVKQEKMPAAQWIDWINSLQKKGVKPEEIEWSGVREWLDLQTGMLTKNQVAGFISSNGLQIEEVVISEPSTTEGYDVVDWRGGVVESFDSEMDAADFASELINSTGMPHVVSTSQNENSQGVKYEEFRQDGGTNYREILLCLPKLPDKPVVHDRERRSELEKKVMLSLEEHAELMSMRGDREQGNYKSSHWDQENILVHFRVDDRIDKDGQKVLMVHELQSDWGQDIKRHGVIKPVMPLTLEEEHELHGLRFTPWADRTAEHHLRTEQLVYRASHTETKGMPNAPFVTRTNAWVSLAFKRIMMMAIESGYEKVAVVNGDQANVNANLLEDIKEVRYLKNVDGTFNLTLIDDEGVEIDYVNRRRLIDIPLDQLGKLLNVSIADQIYRGEGELSQNGRLSLGNLDIKIGGEGMKVFYDQIIPIALRDILRKNGGASLSNIHFNGCEYYGFEISEAMKMFCKRGMSQFSVAKSELSDPDLDANNDTCLTKENEFIERMR